MANPHSVTFHTTLNRSNRPNALAEIQFASITDPELTPSEDETAESPPFQNEDAQSVIGISIGQAQTRLTSPRTPAAEKAAALDDLEGGGLFDRTWQRINEERNQQQQEQVGQGYNLSGQSDGNQEDEQSDSPVRMPSPWQAKPRKFQRTDDYRASLRESLGGHRRRASSGATVTDAFRKYLSFNLPSMPKTPNILNFSLPTLSGSEYNFSRSRAAGEEAQTNQDNIPGHAAIGQTDGYYGSRPDRMLQSSQPHLKSSTTLGGSGSSPMTDNRNLDSPFDEISKMRREHASSDSPSETPVSSTTSTYQLRRSISDNSLLLHRGLSGLSRAPSLGDDTRFEHVSDQVNSRLKALKDSWQDANFKLPSMPTLPNFSFGSREDMLRKPRYGSFIARNLSPSPGAGSRSHSSSLSGGITRPRMSSNPKMSDPGGVAGMTASNASSHPFFTKALKDITGDLVVLGGYRGSVLRSAEPPNKQLWVPIKVGLNIRKVDLEVGLNPEDEETEEERIIPGGMLKNIGPVDISRRLFKRLRASENAKNGSLRVHDYGYDWRLSPHLLARKMIRFLEKLPCNAPGTPKEKRGAIVIAHSLGGLITRNVINQRPDLISGVVYAGVPQTCVNILGPLRNGDDVLLSSRVLTAQVNFTIRTSFALLPLDGSCFIDKNTKEPYHVDFFDPNTWKEYRLSPCIAPSLPPLPSNNNNNNTMIGGILNAMSNALPVIGRKGSISKGSNNTSGNGTPTISSSSPNLFSQVEEGGAQEAGFAPKMNAKHAGDPAEYLNNQATSPSTAVTIPKEKAWAYLERTLAEVKRFKEELAFNPDLAEDNLYPPAAVIYGKSTPTLYAAKVDGREGIKRADAYEDLAFASGDGVVLAKSAMIPEGYSVVRGGVVSSERGHVTLLGDLEAVGRCLGAVIAGRKAGVGLGREGRGVKESSQKATQKVGQREERYRPKVV